MAASASSSSAPPPWRWRRRRSCRNTSAASTCCSSSSARWSASTRSARCPATGAQGFTWLIFLGIFFFIPYALLIAEIGSAFTEEGGPYVWTKLAFGRFLACLNGVLYWISNPIWMGGLLTITAIETFSVFFTSLDNRILFYGFGALFIWFGTVAAILSFGIGKWIPTIGAWSRMIMLGFFTLTTIIYAAKEGVHAPAFGDFQPSYAIFIGLVPVLFFNYVGFELPNTAGDEMENAQRTCPFTGCAWRWLRSCSTVCRSSAIIIVLPATAPVRPGRLHRRDEDGVHRVRRQRLHSQ